MAVLRDMLPAVLPTHRNIRCYDSIPVLEAAIAVEPFFRLNIQSNMRECAGVKAVKTRTCGTARRCVFGRQAGDGESSAITRPCLSTWMGAIALQWILNRSGVAPDRGSSPVTRLTSACMEKTAESGSQGGRPPQPPHHRACGSALGGSGRIVK